MERYLLVQQAESEDKARPDNNGMEGNGRRAKRERERAGMRNRIEKRKREREKKLTDNKRHIHTSTTET